MSEKNVMQAPQAQESLGHIAAEGTVLHIAVQQARSPEETIVVHVQREHT